MITTMIIMFFVLYDTVKKRKIVSILEPRSRGYRASNLSCKVSENYAVGFIAETLVNPFH